VRKEPRNRPVEIALVAAVFAIGLALRLRLAATTYLNPDEALHALISFGTWRDTLGQMLTVTHPPLFILITHLVFLISRTELALRTIPVVAGSLFPVLFSIWLWRVAGKIAGFAALVLLTFAPHLVTISAQLRSYTLAFLFLSASLIVLEEALQRGEWALMAVYSVLLWLSILSDYSMAWFAGAAGVYALLRLRGSSIRMKATWIAGQAVALMLYGVLFVIQVRNLRGGASAAQAVGAWLAGAFPRPGGMFSFPAVNTLKQFAYLMASVPVGAIAALLFAIGVLWLWTGRTRMEPRRARALAALLVIPFLLGIAGAYAHWFPYGRSRHTLVAGLFGAAGIAIFLETLPRRAGTLILAAILLLTPLWYWKAEPDVHDISPDRHQRKAMLECVEYMRASIPPSAVIFSEWETLLMLLYYEGHNQVPERREAGQGFFEITLGGRWRAAERDYSYSTAQELQAALAAFRRQYGLTEHEPVWVIDGGWDRATPEDPRLPFSKAIHVFQAGAP